MEDCGGSREPWRIAAEGGASTLQMIIDFIIMNDSVLPPFLE